VNFQVLKSFSKMASPSANPTDFFTIGQESKQQSKPFSTVTLTFPVDFHNMDANVDIGGTFCSALDMVIERGCQVQGPGAKVELEIYHYSECMDKGILVPFCNKEQLTVERILDLIEETDQHIDCRNNFQLNVVITSVEK
jgi:hypothetical protein